MKFKAIAFAILTTLSLSAAAAETESGLVAQGKLTQDLMQADTNKDGIVSREELIAAKTTEFKQADTNADTFLSWDEFKTLADTKRSNRFNTIFKLMDKDANGSLSSAEFVNLVLDKPVAQTNVVFAILDQNTDGNLTPEELQVLLSAEDSSSNLVWQFAGLDTDLDGKLSVTEYTTKPTTTIVPPPVRGKKPETTNPTTPTVPVVGAYAPADVASDAVVSAAKFAASQLGTATLTKVLSAQSQVVAGTNYRLKIQLSDGKVYELTVYKALDNTMKLVESKLVGASDSNTVAPVDDATAAAAKFAASTLGDATGVQAINDAKSVAISSTIKQFVMTIKLNNGKAYAVIVNQTASASGNSFKLVSYKLLK